MIIYTNGYGLHLTAQELAKLKFIDNIMYSPLNTTDSLKEVFEKRFNGYDGNIIIDNPLYTWNMFEGSSTYHFKREYLDFSELAPIQKLKLVSNNAFDYKSAWRKYIDQVSIYKNALKVLGLYKCTNLININKMIDDIPKEKYWGVSVGLSLVELSAFTEDDAKNLIKICNKSQATNLLFAIKTEKFDDLLTKDQIKIVEKISKYLAAKNINLILNHNAFIAYQLSGLNSVAFGFFKQTNSTSKELKPFVEGTGFRKANASFSYLLFSNMKVDQWGAVVEMYRNSKEIPEDFIKAYDTYIENIKGIDKDRTKISANDAIELKKSMKSSEAARIKTVGNACSIYNSIPQSIREKIYINDPCKYEKMLIK